MDQIVEACKTIYGHKPILDHNYTQSKCL